MKKLAVLLILSSCASVESFPHRGCLYDSAAHLRWRAGTVVEKRADGARLFRFDDPTEGDHGYQWVDDSDNRLSPCAQKELTNDEPQGLAAYRPSNQ